MKKYYLAHANRGITYRYAGKNSGPHIDVIFTPGNFRRDDCFCRRLIGKLRQNPTLEVLHKSNYAVVNCGYYADN